MTYTELTKILEVLQEKHPKGIGVFSLSQKTEIEPNKLREYMEEHSDYFVVLPEENVYAINKFGAFKGSSQKMLKHFETKLQEKSSSNIALYLIVFVSVSALSAVIFSNVI